MYDHLVPNVCKMCTMEIPSLDIWRKFEDLSLPPFSPNLVSSFEETLFFNHSVLDKGIGDDNADASDDLHQSITKLDCSLCNDHKDLSIDTADYQIFSNRLESSFSCDDSFECDNVNTVLLDHSYSQTEHFNDYQHFNMNEKEYNEYYEPINRLGTIRNKKPHEKNKAAQRKPITRSTLKRKLGYTTKCIKNNNFNFEVKFRYYFYKFYIPSSGERTSQLQ
jgi:hypothetical protein